MDLYTPLPCHYTTDWLKLIKKEINSTNELFNKVHLLKCIPGDYLMKLVERMPSVCKAVIKAKGSNLKNLKYNILISLTLFVGYYLITYVLFHNFVLQCGR
jgi:hypothetical protein